MLRKELQAHFDLALKKAKLTKHREALLAEARECIHMHYRKFTNDVPLGASRLGGTPDLPDSIEWPAGSHEGRPFGKAEFLAQFNLAELPDVGDVGLPRCGHVWLFVRDTSLCDLPVCVFYNDGTETLAPREKPKSERRSHGFGWHDLSLVRLDFSVGLSMPFSKKAFQYKWDHRTLPSGDMSVFQQVLGGDLDSYGSREGFDGQIGGYSYQAEHDLYRELAIEQLGEPEYIYADAWNNVAQLQEQIERGLGFAKVTAAKQESYRDHLKKYLPQVKWIEENDERIARTADSIQLLCMFRPNGDLDFGDGMFLDFFINESSLSKLDFSLVHCRLPMLL